MAECTKCHNLLGKVAIITASSTGIGAATAVLLAAKGARLSLNGRDEKALENVALDCQKASPNNEKPYYFIGDLSKEENRRELVRKTLDTYKKLDILVNNLGGGKRGFFETASLADLDEELDLNLRVPFHMCHLSLPHLIESKGCVVNVSSASADLHIPNTICYSTAKSALEAFTKALAADVGRHQVRVNAVSPGPILTDKAHLRHSVPREQYLQSLEGNAINATAIGKLGKPEDVAEVIAFLVSDSASYVTGSVYNVNGGVDLAAAVIFTKLRK